MHTLYEVYTKTNVSLTPHCPTSVSVEGSAVVPANSSNSVVSSSVDVEEMLGEDEGENGEGGAGDERRFGAGVEEALDAEGVEKLTRVAVTIS
uniref:Uncharacterized protein n=1 Tax=Globodera pallida TaxID=36090 RepID=A0A183CL85_GLOPA